MKVLIIGVIGLGLSWFGMYSNGIYFDWIPRGLRFISLAAQAHILEFVIPSNVAFTCLDLKVKILTSTVLEVGKNTVFFNNQSYGPVKVNLASKSQWIRWRCWEHVALFTSYFSSNSWVNYFFSLSHIEP